MNLKVVISQEFIYLMIKTSTMVYLITRNFCEHQFRFFKSLPSPLLEYLIPPLEHLILELIFSYSPKKNYPRYHFNFDCLFW